MVRELEDARYAKRLREMSLFGDWKRRLGRMGSLSTAASWEGTEKTEINA